MNYAVFRSAVLRYLERDREWNVTKDWEEEQPEYRVIGPDSGDDEYMPEDYIELEQEKGAFYVFMTISVTNLFTSYREEGWDAVVNALEKFTRREKKNVRKAADYEDKLNEEGVRLYSELRELRAGIARSRNVPPYIIFMNRSLYEMCCRQPGSMEELKEVYGVGEKNSAAYGGEFLEVIRDFTKGEKIQLMKTEEEPENSDLMIEFIKKRNEELSGSVILGRKS